MTNSSKGFQSYPGAPSTMSRKESVNDVSLVTGTSHNPKGKERDLTLISLFIQFCQAVYSLNTTEVFLQHQLISHHANYHQSRALPVHKGIKTRS